MGEGLGGGDERRVIDGEEKMSEWIKKDEEVYKVMKKLREKIKNGR
ncbi:hypothetical protein [Paenibacillus xylanexedens]|nr:hypothetical protein [Paenibacillus xylanexedens]